MKKFIAIFALAALCLSLFAGCAQEKATPTETATEPSQAEEVSSLEAAKKYLFSMYKDMKATTAADYSVVGVVSIGDETFDVEWTTDSDTIKVVPGENKMVTIDITEENPKEVVYKLTATVKGKDGKTASVSFEHKVPATLSGSASYKDLVEAAYKLEEGMEMYTKSRLFGKIVKVDEAYSEDHKNITVTIQVGDMTDQPIKCFRLIGAGVDALKEGDEITVEGYLKNHKGEVQFDSRCQLVGMGEHMDPALIVDAAYALEENTAMTKPSTLTGKIVKIDNPFDSKYGNVTVTIQVGDLADKLIQCFRMKGDGADKLNVGDEITVEGLIKNYKGTVEFDAGCKLLNVKPFMEPADIVKAAYALEEGKAIPGTTVLTGKVIKINDKYSASYNNITVTIQVGDLADQPIKCFRMKGADAPKLAEGQVITVEGVLKNFKGTVEFDTGARFVVVG